MNMARAVWEPLEFAVAPSQQGRAVSRVAVVLVGGLAVNGGHRDFFADDCVIVGRCSSPGSS